MKKILSLVVLSFVAIMASAQVTTASLKGSVVSTTGEPLIGAVVTLDYTPTGVIYNVTTDLDGRYQALNVNAGGPYSIHVQSLGYQNTTVMGVYLNMADENVLDIVVKEETIGLEELVVTAKDMSNMSSERSGSLTTINAKTIGLTPSVSRSMNDVMSLTPQASVTSNGFAVGGGNYRQSAVTVDGAAFNNGFGIGSNLPAGGTPISLDALDQMAISITPFDVRQSGFVGGAIQATTKAGSNEWKASVYDYFKHDKLQGKYYGDLVDGKRPELKLSSMLQNTIGVTVGGPLVKNKLFFFLNAEYDIDNNPGQNNVARKSENDAWGNGTQVNRPTEAFLQEVSDYVDQKYGYKTGAYQGYSFNSPDWKLLARLDWNINQNHHLQLRYSYTHNYYTTRPSSSMSSFNKNDTYDKKYGRQSQYAMYFQNSCYNQEQNFGSLAAEWTARFAEGRGNNLLRFTWSHQNEPRSYNGGLFPTVDILGEPADDNSRTVITSFGTDPFTYGNLRDVHTITVTDNVTYATGKHTITAGAQFEWNQGINGFMPMGNGYYLYGSWDDFKNQATPLAFSIMHPNNNDLHQEFPTLVTTKYSVYAQDEMDLHKQFKLTLGLRLELPVYPALDCENKNFTEIYANTTGWKTNQVPGAYLNISPRVGFNWDVLGNKRMIVRGGTGVFAGNLPMVWLVSAVGNSNTMQNQLFYTTGNNDAELAKFNGHFGANVNDILTTIFGGQYQKNEDLPANSQSTILAKDLRMPTTWKTSLAMDFNLPKNWKISLEGIFNKDLNSTQVVKGGFKEDGLLTMTVDAQDGAQVFDSRKHYVADGTGLTPYLITNSQLNGYYGSFTGKIEKSWEFGLNLMAAYTFSRSMGINDGIGDQVYGIPTSIGGATANSFNDVELGYSSHVSPHRVVATLSYVIPEKIGSTTIAFNYEGQMLGYTSSGISYTNWTPTMNSDVTGLGACNNTLFIPTEEQLEVMNFASETNKLQFAQWIEGNSYAKSHRGQFAERGCMNMPWHNQLNFKLQQNFFVADGTGRKHNLEVGLDVKNLLNLFNPAWGTYKQVSGTDILSWTAADKNDPSLGGTYKFLGGEKFNTYASTASTWSMMVSLRYYF